jgi:hypothetical protein
MPPTTTEVRPTSARFSPTTVFAGNNTSSKSSNNSMITLPPLMQSTDPTLIEVIPQKLYYSNVLFRSHLDTLHTLSKKKTNNNQPQAQHPLAHLHMELTLLTVIVDIMHLARIIPLFIGISF